MKKVTLTKLVAPPFLVNKFAKSTVGGAKTWWLLCKVFSVHALNDSMPI